MSAQNRHITEIDSLRAVAVLLVVLFHAYPDYLHGGFIGVDIFFVISGFVIARAYLLALIAGERDLREFYIARFRRLAPALAVVLAITSVAAIALLQPDRLLAYGWSLLAQPVYLQNFVFWAEGDYFSGALTKPLLHTWSLAVEEQFYILWAGLILILRRYPKALVWLVVAGALLSFATGLSIEPRSPKTVFFHLPTRIWEFVFGILAYLVSRRFDRQLRGLGAIGTAAVAPAVAAVLFAAIAFPESAVFPGPQALIACSATAVLLTFVGPLSGHASLVWMRIPPVVYIGRISYGFYLWHWPPMAIYYLAVGQVANPAAATTLMGVALFGAVLSFHLVEEPIRRKRRLPNPRAILRFVGTSSTAMVAIALVFLLSDGLIQRYPLEIRPFLTAPEQRGKFRCGKVYVMLHPSAQTCPLHLADVDRQGAVLILGDSHADVIKEMLSDVAREAERNLYLTTRNCDLGRFGSYSFCSRAVLQKLIDEANRLGVTEILAISYWEVDKFDAASMADDLRDLTDAGFSVRILRRVPSHDTYPPRVRAVNYLAGQPLDLSGLELASHLADTADIDLALDQAVARLATDRVTMLSPADYMCPAKQCLYHRNGIPLYLDSNHLTFTGAAVLRPMFDDILTQH